MIEGNMRQVTTDTTVATDNGDCTETVVVTRLIEKFVEYDGTEHAIGEIEAVISDETFDLLGCDGAGTAPVDEVGVCECTNTNNVAPIWDADGSHYIEVEVDGSTQRYATNYGTVCGAWDLDLTPFCDQDNAPEECMQSWCYVDEDC